MAPLVAALRARNLISQFFFLRYWLEGSHVRLRPLPARGVRSQLVAQIAEREVAAFLADHPSPTLPKATEEGPERALLHSYLHMTNNRLGLGVLEEAYVTHLLSRALLKGAPGREC